MPKLYLTIEKNYRPGWGCQEGVRELLQNAKDAETEFGCTMEVDHYKGDVLRIETVGATLDREALLLGHTSKRERSDLIGQFGDGLKIGILALVRSGYEVKIRNGSETWVPAIERHDQYGAEVLCFNITGGNKPENRVRVEIKGISTDMWKAIRSRFLFLQTHAQVGESVKTNRGSILLDPTMSGRIYVKGIFVTTAKGLRYGYDLIYVDTDVDRKIVSDWERNREIRAVWSEAVETRPDLMNHFQQMLDDQNEDIAGIADQWQATQVPTKIREQLAAKFMERFGSDAIPVANMNDSKDLAHFGKEGIVVPKALGQLLQASGMFKPIEEVKREVAKSTSALYSWHNLTPSEQKNLECADLLLKAHSDFDLSKVTVVDFVDPKMEGTFEPLTGRIEISRASLSALPKTIGVLVHEYCHNNGSDGDKNHVQAMENLYEKILGSLL